MNSAPKKRSKRWFFFIILKTSSFHAEATKVDDNECRHCGCGRISCVRVIYTELPAVTASKCVARFAVTTTTVCSTLLVDLLASRLHHRWGLENKTLSLILHVPIWLHYLNSSHISCLYHTNDWWVRSSWGKMYLSRRKQTADLQQLSPFTERVVIFNAKSWCFNSKG